MTLPDIGLSGWRGRLGPGFGYAFSTLLVGGELSYTLSRVTLSEAVYRNLGKASTYHQIGMNAYVGIHFQPGAALGTDS